MQGIDHHGVASRQFPQQAAVCQVYRVRGSVLLVKRIIFVFKMIVITLYFMNFLMQRSTECDIQLLKTAAHGKERHARLERSFCERQCDRVTVRVMQRSVFARRAIIVMRLHV